MLIANKPEIDLETRKLDYNTEQIPDIKHCKCILLNTEVQ